MGYLMTAYHNAARSDVGEADQQGMKIKSDTAVYYIEQSPFITICSRGESLYSLNPPRQLIEDWNRVVPTDTIPNAWEEIDFKERYIDHIEFSPDAQSALNTINLRLQMDNVAIVSGARTYPYCARRVLYEYMMNN